MEIAQKHSDTCPPQHFAEVFVDQNLVNYKALGGVIWSNGLHSIHEVK